ncbi:alpha/beta hydrolase [Dyadobacter frigoris]|uniref:alpha/beta hydrolase n=1 Tax=Dyadobacter frigoris TaxID=2576211 RepID=UPI0014855884|nr:prolyl oligopeptidase family serine peptidase [Dyadobacter frigoris]
MKKSIFAFILCFLSCRIFAQASLQKDLSLAYLISQPRVKTVKPKLIILLHGYGSNEADLFELKNILPADFLIISARAPFTIAPNAFQWYGNEIVKGIKQESTKDLKTSTDLIKVFINEVVKKYNADPSQVFLAGFSQGAMMSYEVGLTAPELLRGIAPLSGRIFDSLKPRIKPANAFNNFKIFIGHGTADDRVPYTSATEAVFYLKKKKINATLHSYQSLPHSISEQELKDLVAWLNEK